ncbi:hypothetical protein HHI36_021458 [Cryptolaemus montrouzieri]|uniref:Uncharacterized protein n=1 Tax=Cryptolaemus montrouzieri TaxID=559131 RepID=A0ABD2MWW5_9CUCU
MLRRAKSFFIKRPKHDRQQDDEKIPQDFLSETGHLARKPIRIDDENGVVLAKEPSDRPETDTVENCDKEKHDALEIRPNNVRRRSPRPHTAEFVSYSRMSFPPLKNGTWYGKFMTRGSRKSVGQ